MLILFQLLLLLLLLASLLLVSRMDDVLWRETSFCCSFDQPK